MGDISARVDERTRQHIDQHNIPDGRRADVARAFSEGFFGSPLTARRHANDDADAAYREIVNPAHAAGHTLWQEMCAALPAEAAATIAQFDPMNSVHSLFERNWAREMEDLRLLEYHGGSCDGSRSYRITEAGRALVARCPVSQTEGDR